MKNFMKKIITAVLLLLVIAAMPAISWAEVEEQKSVAPEQTPAVKQDVPAAAPEQNPVEQKQEEDKVTGEVAASVLSAYIWRGQELSRHSVVIQPSLTASYKGFTANVWGNLDTKPYSGGDAQYSSNFTETDVTLSYSRKFGIVQAGAGYIYYGLAAVAPNGDLPDSQEIFVSVGLDTILAPTLTVYKEIDHYRQWYATFGVSHTFPLHEKMGLKLSALASYLLSTDETTYAKHDSNSVASTTDKYNNFHDGIVSVSLPIAVYKTLSVTPTISYVFPLCDDARYEMRARGLQGAAIPSDKESSSFLYGGVILSYAF